MAGTALTSDGAAFGEGALPSPGVRLGLGDDAPAVLERTAVGPSTLPKTTARISFRGYRGGFLFVVALLAGVAGFSMWRELRTAERVDTLVSQALGRDVLIGRIRVDALNLENAVDAHIQAANDEERSAADDHMEQILEDISLASQQYTRDLPAGEAEIWNRFNRTSFSLAAQVRKAVNYSNRKEAERARRHLEIEIRPITATLDSLAGQLSEKNAEETRALLRHLGDLRLSTTAVGGLVAVMAIVLALLVGWQVTSLLSKQETTIRDQLAELDRRNQELDAFASRVAHDLVSPLSPLKGYLTLIRRSNAIADPALKEMLSFAELSAGRMAEMIEALLRFCRAGKPGEAVVCELDTAVDTILTEVDQSATKEGVKLDRFIQARVLVACPAQLLQSIAQNILSNAVKYTAGRREPHVTVRVSKERGEAVFEVIDNGQGMSAESQRSLFHPFFRAPEARAMPGHGLGLATTKRLVEAHGGTITVRSELNVGTQVTVRFPLAAGPGGVPPTPAREPRTTGEPAPPLLTQGS